MVASASFSSASPASACLPDDGAPSPATLPPGEMRLVRPENARSRYWVHFMRYDPERHPEKRTTARCSLCGQEISVKQGTGGLKNHLKFKHPRESSALVDDADEVQASRRAASPPSRGDAAAGVAADPPRKKPRHGGTYGGSVYEEITMRMDAERRKNEKHWMGMWANTRLEIKELRKELRDEDDEGMIGELEKDLRVMMKKKDDYAELLGVPRDESAFEEV